MKIIVVGGVAAGMSAAARARRLAEDAEIIVFEKDHYVSFANCGLPYHISGDIQDRDQLLVVTPAELRSRLNLDVRTEHEVIRIDQKNKLIAVRDLTAGREFWELRAESLRGDMRVQPPPFHPVDEIRRKGTAALLVRA